MAITKTSFFPKLIPGVLLAPTLLIPLGIIFYGLNFRIDQLGQLNSLSVALMLVALSFTVLAIYVFAAVLRLRTPLAHLLAAGSAVCGASAIAIVSPVVDAEPDELGTALVTNTMLVIVSMLVLNALMPLVTEEVHATVAGALLQQTGFIKMTVAKGPYQDLALAIKSARVGLLIFIVPIVYYLTSKRLYIPWYLVLFILVGLFHSNLHFPAPLTDMLTLAYGLIFNCALASIGLNANIVSVVRTVFLPLALTIGVFMISLAIFVGGELVFHL